MRPTYMKFNAQLKIRCIYKLDKGKHAKNSSWHCKIFQFICTQCKKGDLNCSINLLIRPARWRGGCMNAIRLCKCNQCGSFASVGCETTTWMRSSPNQGSWGRVQWELLRVQNVANILYVMNLLKRLLCSGNVNRTDAMSFHPEWIMTSVDVLSLDVVRHLWFIRRMVMSACGRLPRDIFCRFFSCGWATSTYVGSQVL